MTQHRCRMRINRAELFGWNDAIQRSMDEYHLRPIRACLEEGCLTLCPGEGPLCSFHARRAA